MAVNVPNYLDHLNIVARYDREKYHSDKIITKNLEEMEAIAKTYKQLEQQNLHRQLLNEKHAARVNKSVATFINSPHHDFSTLALKYVL